jgi:hypothetical protein
MFLQGCLIEEDGLYSLIDWNDFNDKVKEGSDRELTALKDETKKWKKVFRETCNVYFTYKSWRL